MQCRTGRTGRLLPWIVLLLLIVMFSININILKPWSAFSKRSSDEDGLITSSVTLCEGSSVVRLHSRAQMVNYTEMVESEKGLEFKLKPSLIELTAGKRRSSAGFLTIGVPSIKRLNGAEYLMKTLTSLSEQTSAAEKEMVVVLVFLADQDSEYTQSVSKQIQKNFPQLVESGFIQVITVPSSIYPPLKNLKRNFNDAPTRVTWRSKQVVDFAIMFTYAHVNNLSEFYVQVEDDILCSANFVPAIKEYITRFSKKSSKSKTMESHWVMLEFSELGFIGKLFRGSELPRLAKFLLMFYDEQPVDWLMTAFRLSAGQRLVLLRKPTLFQHIGLKSSFDTSKDNPLKDRYFDGGSKPIAGASNPPASVFSTMPHHADHIPDLAYSSGSGFFWATKVSEGDTLSIILEEAARVTRIAIVTGNTKAVTDLLVDGTLSVSAKVTTLDEKNKTAACVDNLVEVGKFNVEGKVDVSGVDSKLTEGLIRCIVVRVNKNHNNWIAFNQIAVFV